MPASSKDFLNMQVTIEREFTLKLVGDMIRRYSQTYRTDKYSEHSLNTWSVYPNGWVFVSELSDSRFGSSCSYLNVRSRARFEQGTPNIQATIERGFTVKRVRDIRRRYSQMNCKDKYSEHSSIICSVWPNGGMFICELSGTGFESSCSHLNFRFPAWLEQGVPWHSGN